jgi:hypothetical protein
MAKGNKNAENMARAIFMHAESFARAAETLAQAGEQLAKPNAKHLKSLSVVECAPIAANDSFATELYLKSLYWIDRGCRPDGVHTFTDLFYALSKPAQDSIRTWYIEKRDKQYGALLRQHQKHFPGFDHSLENCLKLSNNTFVKMRYAFEGINQPIFYWPPLRVAIRNVIASTAPGWSWATKK